MIDIFMLIIKVFMIYLLSDTFIWKFFTEIFEIVGKVIIFRACVEKRFIFRVMFIEWFKFEIIKI